MDKFLKSEHLDISLNSSSVDKEFAHQYRTFSVFIYSIQTNDSMRLKALFNFVSPTVYEYITECDDYESAINILKALSTKEQKDRQVCGTASTTL